MEQILSFPLLLLFFFLSLGPFPSCYHSFCFPKGASHVHSVSRKNSKPKARPMLCSVSLQDWLWVPSDKSLIPWWVCFCILPKICGEACCTWFNFLRTKLIWSSPPRLVCGIKSSFSLMLEGQHGNLILIWHLNICFQFPEEKSACVCVCGPSVCECVGERGIVCGCDEPRSFQSWEQPSQLTFKGGFGCKKWWQLIALASAQLQFATVDLGSNLSYSTVECG